MNVKKIIAIVVVVVGIVMVGGSMYINNQVEQGKMQVSSAERKVNRGKAIFSLSPATEGIGDQMAKSADRKISNAKGEISYYANMAQNLLIGGIVLIILGALLYVFALRSKK